MSEKKSPNRDEITLHNAKRTYPHLTSTEALVLYFDDLNRARGLFTIVELMDELSSNEDES